jgi:hypothetical protein
VVELEVRLRSFDLRWTVGFGGVAKKEARSVELERPRSYWFAGGEVGSLTWQASAIFFFTSP